ncbi:unnamed protein product [Phytophthora fragariaefolia]|uniref:Unnamed protein product n=1 Tax=Phytophthora fragariaefolia TaxID=1490495 RepID=A0A9W6U7M2_9STRA|nr:unnamed protein product [Phytophthora fragariaefolia]
MDPALHAAAHTTPFISARGAANCANKCTMLASAKSSKSKKSPTSPPTETGLVPIGLPQLAAPAIEAECIFAFVGKCEWPNDGDDIIANTAETEQERGTCLGGGEMNKEPQEEVNEEGPDNWILSARREEKPRRELAKEVQLLPGERLGWWSEQKFDRRVRMRTLANAKLPDEVMIPLIKTMSMLDEPEVPQTEEGPTESMAISGREWREVKLRRNKPPTPTQELWIRRTEKLIPSVTKFHKGRPTRVRWTNLTDRLVLCPTHLAIVAWVPVGTLPKHVGYVRVDSKKYSEWQALAYEAVRDKTLFRRERELYEECLAAQPPALFRRHIADEKAEDSSVDEDPAGSHEVHEGIVSVAISGPPTAGGIKTAHSGNARSKAKGTVHEAVVSEAMTNSEPPGCSPGVRIAVATTIEASPDNSIDVLEQTFVSVVRVLTTEGTERGDGNSYEHDAAEFELEYYAKELAFLPDLTEPAETKLDYTANNVRNPEMSTEQQASLIAVLKNHDKIMIASGNALPPPAYGVVCDIDVGGHAPIKQRARRIPLRQLKKLYELLKGLLKAGLIAFSDSPWASPIVFVLKKNGLNIRICIGYKLVNAVTMIMEYAMPLVDDLLTDLEAY